MKTPLTILGALLTLALLAPGPARGQASAYTGARIWTGDGPPIDDGVLVVAGGKVTAVGPRARVSVPAGAEVTDLRGAVIIPGLVIAETALGEKGADDERSLTPHFRAIDGFDFYADFGDVVAGGVTTVQISPGRGRLVPGQGAVVKLAGPSPRERTLRDRERLRIMLGSAFKNPPRIYDAPIGAVAEEKPLEPTRPQLASTLAGAVAGLRATFRAAEEYRGTPAGERKPDALLQAVADALGEGGGLRVTAPGAADIRAAMGLAGEFNARVLLVDAEGFGPVREQLGSWKKNLGGVVLNAKVRPGRVFSPSGSGLPWETARELRAAGYKVAIRPASDDDLPDMLFVGGLFVGGGIEPEDALAMLTSAPAELLGVADRVGSLAEGKDADFVVLSGDPFATHTRVRAVHVNGQKVHTAKEERQAAVIRADRIYTGTGEVITPGAVVVEGSTIRGVGRDVSAPADAVEHRYPGAVIVPGFLDLGTGLGFDGPLTGTVPLQTKLSDFLSTGDPGVSAARQGGVTTVLLVPSGRSGGPVLALKLTDRPRVLAEPAAIRFSVSGNLTATESSLRRSLQTGKRYADTWKEYEAELAEYEKKKAEYDKKKAAGGEEKLEEPRKPAEPTKNASQEPYRLLFAGKIPALVEAEQTNAIRLAVKLFREEFDVRTVLTGGGDAFRLADLLAAKGVQVAVGPELVKTADHEAVNLPQVLAGRKVPFGFQSQATAGAQTLSLAVRYAVHKGLGTEDALAGLTTAPAKFLSLDGVGTLAEGKDADLVVLSGPPFELSSRVLAVMIDGRWVYQAKGER